jgi:hypothetical protein
MIFLSMRKSYNPSFQNAEAQPISKIARMRDIPTERLHDIPTERLHDIPTERLHDIPTERLHDRISSEVTF